MRSLLSVTLAFSILLLAKTGIADVGDWIDGHPTVAFSIRWQHATGGSRYDIRESNKTAWPDWTLAQRQDLIDAFDEATAWYYSADPWGDLDETIAYPPTNIAPDVGDDSAPPEVLVDGAYAWDLYVRWVALVLLTEIEGHFPWSILDYDTDELKLLLDSTSMMRREDSGDYELAADNPWHASFRKRFSVLGTSLIAPPRYTLAFLETAGLVGTDRFDTIARLLDWGTENMVHFYGEDNYGNMEAHWQYRGLAPITRIIEGTVRDGESEPRHWTAGCHGTTGFWKNVLRAANIPMEITTICGHSQAYFVTEDLYIDHGDNVYNLTFKDTGLPASELLIDSTTHLMWFGPSPFNHDFDEFCTGDDKIGEQVNVLAGTAEACLDGVDNDGDGDVDCDDADCEPVTVFTQTKLTADDSVADDHFGSALDIDGDRAIVGAYEHYADGEDAGAAYLFEYASGMGWYQAAKLSPSDAGSDRHFGYSVGISGNTAVAAGDLAEGFTGAAYVFEEESTGDWLETVKLEPAGVVSGDRLGNAADIDGDTIALGAMGDDGDTGAVYVFRRTGAGWAEDAKLQASDGMPGDLFGYEVDISGDAIVIGAYGNDEAGDMAGAAYVFRHNGSAWIEEAKLLPPDLDVYDHFGWSVAIDEDAVIVGAMYQDELAANAGAAYLFRFDGALWNQEAKLFASDGLADEYFGVGVGIYGNKAVVGAYGEDHIADRKALFSPDEDVGAAYLFEYDGSTWMETRKLIPNDGVETDRFGYVVPMSENTVLVGAYGDDDNGEMTGAAYLFDLGETEVGQCSSVVPVDPTTGGSPVSINFFEIVRAGTSTVTSSSTGADLPESYQLGDPPTYYEITTTADYFGDVEVCIDYSDVTYTSESSLTVLHLEEGAWVDLCESPDSCTQDTSDDIICAITDSLSQFAVAMFNPLFNDVTMDSGYQTHDEVFLAQDFGQVGDLVLLDVFVPSYQPNPYWVGQVQMTVTIESEGIFCSDMGTVQLTGLPLGAWSNLTFTVPASVQDTLLSTISAGHFTLVTNTPYGAEPLVFDNFRFGGDLVTRPSEPERGDVEDLFSFEDAGDWSLDGGLLSADTLATHGDYSLSVERTSTYAVIESADFITDEVAEVGDTLTIDLMPDAQAYWGSLQAMLSCPQGENQWIGQAALTGRAAGFFHTLSIPLAAAIQDELNTPEQVCSLSLVINAPAEVVYLLDNLNL